MNHSRMPAPAADAARTRDEERSMRDMSASRTRPYLPQNGGSRDEAVQLLRERNFSRTVKGAQALGLDVGALSNRQKRILAAVTDLPEVFESSRERTDGDLLSRDLTALRARLDWLVRVEEEHGDDQRGRDYNRSERNALIRLLQEHAARAGAEVKRSPSAKAPKYDHAYILRIEEQVEQAIASGFTLTKQRMPGLLYHAKFEDAEPQEVAMNVWFAVRGATRGEVEQS